MAETRTGIVFVVAADENGVIGRAGGLPWHLPDDLRRFRALTTGHAIVMGRRTHDSIGRPLPDRRNLVLTRDRAWSAPGVETLPGPEPVVEIAAREPVFVIGGAEIFALFAAQPVERIVLTRVHAAVRGDVFLPPLDLAAHALAAFDHHPADDRHAFAFSVLDYRRR